MLAGLCVVLPRVWFVSGTIVVLESNYGTTNPPLQRALIGVERKNKMRRHCPYMAGGTIKRQNVNNRLVKSTHDAYENTWKCGELKLYFSSSSAGGCKKKTLDYIIKKC